MIAIYIEKLKRLKLQINISKTFSNFVLFIYYGSLFDYSWYINLRYYLILLLIILIFFVY